MVNLDPHKLYTVNDLKTYYEQGKIVFNTEYQRSEVWKLPRKQKLIDSILKNYSIGMVFLRENNGSLEVLDGQQRLRSLFEFMGLMGDGKRFLTNPEMTPEFPDKSYEDVSKSPSVYANFIAFKIPGALVREADDEVTADIFLRLQEGIPLNSAEKLNAMRGRMRNIVCEISQHPLLKKTRIDDKRFAHRLLCAQIMHLEFNSKLEDLVFPDIKFKDLREVYRKYKNQEPPSWLESKTKKIFNLLEKTLNNHAKLISKRGDFIPIYLLTTYLDKNFVLLSHEERLRDFILDFLVKVHNINLSSHKFSKEEIEYKEYKEARSTGALSSRSFKKRFEIILSRFLLFVPDIELKDKTRDFDYGQKLAIYQRDEGICFHCLKEVDWDNFDADHRPRPFSTGGPTIVDNGVCAHKTCNLKAGNKVVEKGWLK